VDYSLARVAYGAYRKQMCFLSPLNEDGLPSFSAIVFVFACKRHG